MKISAIVLLGKKNDQVLLKKCLDSVSWTDEIIKVETIKLKGSFSDWRNYGARKANGDWLLYIDTDEIIGDSLRKEIINKIASNEFSGYAIPRRNIFLGHEMHWGGWYPDYVLRLIKRANLVGWYGDVHEQPKINGPIGYLTNPLIHQSHRNLSEMVDKTNAWSEIEAKLLYESHHPRMNAFRFFSAGFREFWYRGFMKLGFLDGTVGIIEVMYQTFSRLVTYSKLWEMQLNPK